MTRCLSPDTISGGSPSYTQRFSFTGEGFDLFILWLKNAALGLVTLGIYYAWGKAATLRFIYSNIEIAGTRLRFTGTGREIFRGIMILAGVYAGFTVGYILVVWIFRDTPIFKAVFFIGYAALFVYLVQYAVFSSFRYRFSRTQLREIRFGVRGTPAEFAKQGFLRFLLVPLTLGIYYPHYSHWKTSQLWNRLHYGSLDFRFDAPRDEFARRLYVGFFGSLFTLGIYSWFFFPKWIAFKRHHTWVGEDRFRCEFRTGEYFFLSLTNLLLITFTLGIGTAWAVTRTLRFFASRTVLEGNTPLETALQTAAQASGSFGEALAGAMDMDVGLDLAL